MDSKKEKILFTAFNNSVCETQAIGEQEKPEYKSSEDWSSSEEEHKVNALALGADEGRDKLR